MPMFRLPTRLCLLLIVCAAVIAGSAAAASPAGPCHAVSYHSVPALGAQRMCMNAGVKTHGNEHYQQVGEITAAGNFYKNVANVAPGHDVDPHELRITPQGDALIDVTDPVQMNVNGHQDLVENYVVQKLPLVRDASGIHTGKL